MYVQKSRDEANWRKDNSITACNLAEAVKQINDRT